MDKSICDVKFPQSSEVPILISVPHAGVDFPQEKKNLFREKFIDCPEDTDWFVDRLYDWAPELGMTVIKANYSRYVIDLNRDPNGAPLYHDGRTITELCPTKSFALENLYVAGELTKDEISNRREKYFDPYHSELKKQLDRLHKKFGKVLLWDAHSIKRHVPSIQPDSFPDLILGSNDGHSCRNDLENVVKKTLAQGPYHLSLNHPFKGGHITRTYGDVPFGIHALQLEMSQDIYMNEKEMTWNHEKSSRVKELLKSTLRVARNFLKVEI